MLKENLTKQEKEVLKLACLTSRDIQERLNIADTTVHTHFYNCRVKLNASNKTESLIKAIKKGEISIDEVITF